MTGITRRGFLKAAGAVAATLILPQERTVWALDRTMITQVIPAFRPGLGFIAHDLSHATIRDWHLSYPLGVVVPGIVEAADPDCRIAFVTGDGIVQAHVSSRFPKGIGVPSADRIAVERAYQMANQNRGLMIHTPHGNLPLLVTR